MAVSVDTEVKDEDVANLVFHGAYEDKILARLFSENSVLSGIATVLDEGTINSATKHAMLNSFADSSLMAVDALPVFSKDKMILIYGNNNEITELGEVTENLGRLNRRTQIPLLYNPHGNKAYVRVGVPKNQVKSNLVAEMVNSLVNPQHYQTFPVSAALHLNFQTFVELRDGRPPLSLSSALLTDKTSHSSYLNQRINTVVYNIPHLNLFLPTSSFDDLTNYSTNKQGLENGFRWDWKGKKARAASSSIRNVENEVRKAYEVIDRDLDNILSKRNSS